MMNREDKMQIINQKDLQEFEEQVKPWLEKNRIPVEKYQTLLFHEKALLCNWLSDPNCPKSANQLTGLYEKLFGTESRFSSSGEKATDSIRYEQLRKLFSPLTPSEKLPYLYKF